MRRVVLQKVSLVCWEGIGVLYDLASSLITYLKLTFVSLNKLLLSLTLSFTAHHCMSAFYFLMWWQYLSVGHHFRL